MVCVAYYCMAVFAIPCYFKALTGLPCPGCGMTRAWFGVLRGDVGYAFAMNPMFWSVPLLYLYILADGKLFGRPMADRIVLGLLLGGMAALFVLRLAVPAFRAGL